MSKLSHSCGRGLGPFVLFGLFLAVTMAPAARGAGVVTSCDEARLKKALTGGSAVTFECSGAILLTSTITIAADPSIDATGHGRDQLPVLRQSSR